MDQLLLPVADAGRLLGIGRTKTYELIDSGDLRTVTIGRRRLVPAAELESFVERLMPGR